MFDGSLEKLLAAANPVLSKNSSQVQNQQLTNFGVPFFPESHPSRVS
jgi:hypothetical protein